MGIFELNNTETQVVIPQPSDLEAAFGIAVLKAMDIGNQKALDAIMGLRADAKKTMESLADLVHEMSAHSDGKAVEKTKSLKAARGKAT